MGLNTAVGTVTSATAALTASESANAAVAVGTMTSFGLLSNTIDNSIAASEAFFHQTLDNSFNADDNITGLSASPVSEFSSAMAKMTGGVASTTNLIKGINNATFGYTSTGANAEMDRNNSQGKLGTTS